jgi:hypothetical protein
MLLCAAAHFALLFSAHCMLLLLTKRLAPAAAAAAARAMGSVQ